MHGFKFLRDSEAFLQLASLRDDEAFFKDSSLEMDTWFSSHHLWCLYRDGAAFLSATIADIEMLGGVTASVCPSRTFDYVPEVRSSRNRSCVCTRDRVTSGHMSRG